MSAPPAQPMMNVPSAEPSPPPVQGTVLCIEDHAASMDLVEAMLAGFPGVRLLKAYTGQEGIHLAQTEKPDLVLLDMRLPDTSGLEVVRTLNQQMADRRLRVVLLTSEDVYKRQGRVSTEGAVEPDRDLARHLQGVQALAVADAVGEFVRGLVARTAQQVEELADLRVHAQALIHGTQQLGLRGLHQAHADARGDVLRDGFGQQPQLDDAAGGIKREQPLGRRAQIDQQRRVFGQELEIASCAHPCVCVLTLGGGQAQPFPDCNHWPARSGVPPAAPR